MIIPSESNFLPIGNAIETLHEFDNIFSHTNTRIQQETAIQLKKNCLELIEKTSSPNIKSRSVTNSALCTELHLWLLQSIKKTYGDLEELFQEVAPHALEAAAILNTG